ncbi:MAG: hypothetical protein ACJ8R9_26095 [Steroidobacteraceae bacterium]
MKILAVNSARAIWLVNTLRLNPRGRSLVPVIVGLAERYKFSKLPQANSLTTQPLDLKFEGGVFVASDGTQVAVSLSILDDGIIADTRASTDESDKFLEDAASWASAEYGLPHYSEVGVDRLYVSELIVQLDLSANLFSQKFSGFTERLRRGVSNNPGMPMELMALHFAPDPSQTKKVASFKIERLANVPFDRNEYYSAAPVPTSEHIELLHDAERFGSSRHN